MYSLYSIPNQYTIPNKITLASLTMTDGSQDLVAERITVRGLVQGVGFRPAVWRLARRHNIRGHVANNGLGVEIMACGKTEDLERFIAALKTEPPPLARVEKVDR